MSKILKEKLTSFDEAVEVAYNSPDHVIEVDTPYGRVEIRIAPFKVHIDEKKRVIKKKDKVAKKKQKEIIEALYGAWPIDETADELIGRIKCMRKDSKIISLNNV